jgi:hypothetical protein
VHGLSSIPENYETKFNNWMDIECIKQDSDLLIIELDFSSLNILGNFLVKSVADIDKRLSEKFDIERYSFDEEDVPENEITPIVLEDEDFLEKID